MSALRSMKRQSTKLSTGDSEVLSIARARAEQLEQQITAAAEDRARVELALQQQISDLRSALGDVRAELAGSVAKVRDEIGRVDASQAIALGDVCIAASDRADDLQRRLDATLSWRIVAGWRWVLAFLRGRA